MATIVRRLIRPHRSEWTRVRIPVRLLRRDEAKRPADRRGVCSADECQSTLVRRRCFLLMRLDKPQPLIDPARDFCEQICCTSIVQLVRFIDGRAGLRSKGGKRAGNRLNMCRAIGDL